MTEDEKGVVELAVDPRLIDDFKAAQAENQQRALLETVDDLKAAVTEEETKTFHADPHYIPRSERGTVDAQRRSGVEIENFIPRIVTGGQAGLGAMTVRERDNREIRSFAFRAALDVAFHRISKGTVTNIVTAENIVADARVFEAYLKENV